MNNLVQNAAYVLMSISVIAAIAVVILPNIFHAALSLVITLLGIAGIYLILHAEFLAIIQILLYVGAVVTLIIFAIMLTEGIGNKTIAQHNNLGPAVFGGAIVFLASLWGVIHYTPWPIAQAAESPNVTIAALAESLLGNYVFPFEVISVILIAVLIGAIVIAKKD